MPKETDENCEKNTTKYEIFFAGLPPRTRPGAAAPDPAWGYRPRPLVLSPPPPIEHPRHLPRGRRLPGDVISVLSCFEIWGQGARAGDPLFSSPLRDSWRPKYSWRPKVAELYFVMKIVVAISGPTM